MAKTLLRFGFFLGPYVLQNRFFNSLERDPEWERKMEGFSLRFMPISLKVKIHLAWPEVGSLPNWVAVSLLSYLFSFLDGLQTWLQKGHKGVEMDFFPGPIQKGGEPRAMPVVSIATV